MKYYFAHNCYWDSERYNMFRDDVPVQLPISQKKLLARLLKNNGHFVHHEELYHAMNGVDPYEGDTNWKSDLSNKFTRKKANDTGLLTRVPEIEPFFGHDKGQYGGYKISLPKEHIVDTTITNADVWDVYRDIWHSKKYWDTQQTRARIADKAWLSKNAKSYLQGGSCNWPLAFASSQYAPVRRDVVDELIEAVESNIGTIVLTGAGGEGKTTILRQLCVELHNAGKTVFYHAATHKYDIPDNVVDGVFLVDHPDNSQHFRMFLSRAKNEGLTVVIASRSNEWAILENTLPDDTKRSIKKIEVPKISISESKAFAQYIKTHIPQTKRSIIELEKLFLQDSYGFLYASMLMIIYNANSLEKIAEQIINKISEFEDGITTLKILAAIVFAEHAGSAIGTRTYRSLCKHFSVDDKKIKHYLRKEVVLNGTVYQTRHESISQLFYKYLFKDGDWWSLYEEEREDVIIAVLDACFEEVTQLTRDCKPTDLRALEIANLFLQALQVIDYEETQEFILQRLFESCKQHGHAIIDRVYHHTTNEFVRSTLAVKCFESKLPVWEIYNQWTRHLLDVSKHDNATLENLRILCVDMGAPINLWVTWANAQKDCTTIGGVDAVREIYLLGVDKLSDISEWWRHWAAFEVNKGNVGSVTIEYSARWLFNKGCSCDHCGYHIWWDWIDLELQLNNIGSVDNEYTARWIANEGCNKTDSVYLWNKRAEIEIINNNFGDIYTEGTGRWCLHIATTKYPSHPDAWIKWARTEEQLGNIGSYEILYSAAWIYKEACEKALDDAIWISWAKFVDRNQNGLPTSYSPEIILKTKCLSGTTHSAAWIIWAMVEESCGNIGTYLQEYSAAWIIREGCLRHASSNDTSAFVRWAKFAHRNPLVDENGTLIDAKYVLDCARKTCPTFDNQTRIDLNFKEELD